MQNKSLNTMITLIAVLMMFPSSFIQGSNNNAKENTKYPSVSPTILVAGSKNCIDPNAPCTAEPFSNSTCAAVSPATSTQVVVCGVNLYNALGTKVMTLSQNVSVTWDAYGYNINWATRSTWVLNSAYYWSNLVGPSPTSGHGNVYSTNVTTSGDAYYLGGYWSTHGVHTIVQGNQSNAYWSCQGTY